ncbi:MAG: stage II sporulation protein R [Oscillospiraceae bacterium]|jgi:stage II sporulation protein R|nr:stage II sporulation protein R [Oscillospiraceae bacterium]
MKLKKWELSLLAALIVTLLCGAAAERDGRALSDKLIRLHVIANSDAREDQELKLAVRDRVLETLTGTLDGVTGRGAAMAAIERDLTRIAAEAEDEARRRGYDYTVTASLRREDFPTREYDGFSLPAGSYVSLRVELGAATGRNWWCVVFPPLCAAASIEDTGAAVSLTGDELSLITEDSGAYVVKFKALELLARVRSWF